MFLKDHLHLIKESAPFYPIIYSGNCQSVPNEYNTAIVHLPADMKSDLNWSSQVKEAKALLSLGKQILWYLDFKLENLSYPFDHKLQFEALKLAVDTFTTDIYRDFKDSTLGVLLFKGKLEEILPFFGPTGTQHEILSTADIFVDFLRLFFPALPDDILPFLKLKIDFENKAFIYQLLSKERFEYFSLITSEKYLFTSSLSLNSSPLSIGYMGQDYKKEARVLPTVGLLFPPDDLFPLVDNDINETFSKIIEIPIRVIYESFLIDEIDGIDKLIIFEKGVSSRGIRQIQGYLAAGGEVIIVGNSLGFSDEISFDDFLKNRDRGIRTPDLLVPNQSR